MTYPEIDAAWRLFRRGKTPTPAIDAFAYGQEAELMTLASQISDRTYRHGLYARVTVHEKKRRDLAVASVRDRVVHRYVYDRLVHRCNAFFDPDVWSCRRGKGLYGALARTQALLAKHPHSFVWRADIHKFFDHVSHATLRRAVERKLGPNSELTWLCVQVIASYEVHTEVGIPIGNLTSQVFANIYLNEFDRFVRHVLKPQAYVRYGDDIVLWAKSRHEARTMREHAARFLADTLHLALNPRNDVIVRAGQGLHFLGHVVTSTYSVVDRHTTRAALAKSSVRSIASYKSLQLARFPKRQLDWQLLDELEGLGVL